MRPTMCINVLRPRPFKFGWVSISLCYAKISIFCSASSAPLSFQYRDFIVINIFCMCLCTHGFIMVHRSRAFSRCMVDYTLMTDQMMTIFVFHFIWGHVPGGWICYQYSTGRTSSDFNENQPKHQNRNFLKTFCNYLWWNLFTTFI